MPDRETIAVYVLLAGTFIKCNPYDARGALVLLRSMAAAFDRDPPKFLGTALHFNATASRREDDEVRNDARWSLTRVVVHLERMLAQPESAP